VPLYAPPPDLLTVDLSEFYPELKDKRVRGRVDGRKVVPCWTRADIERGDLPRERASMQGISAWAKAHPEQTRALLDENPS